MPDIHGITDLFASTKNYKHGKSFVEHSAFCPEFEKVEVSVAAFDARTVSTFIPRKLHTAQRNLSVLSKHQCLVWASF